MMSGDGEHKGKYGHMKGAAGGGGMYGLGFIGALIYFFQQADTFGLYVVGFLKAIVWPAYLVYHLFTYLHI